MARLSSSAASNRFPPLVPVPQPRSDHFRKRARLLLSEIKAALAKSQRHDGAAFALWERSRSDARRIGSLLREVQGLKNLARDAQQLARDAQLYPGMAHFGTDLKAAQTAIDRRVPVLEARTSSMIRALHNGGQSEAV